MPLLKPAEPMPSARLKRSRMFSNATWWVSGDPNPIAHLAKHDPQARDFAGRTGPDYVLTADDLAPDDSLAQAASISRLIVWRRSVKPDSSTP